LSGKILYKTVPQEQADTLLEILNIASQHPSKCHCCVGKMKRNAWGASFYSVWQRISTSLQGERQRTPSTGNQPPKSAVYTPSPTNTSGVSASASSSTLQGVSTANLTPAAGGSSNNSPQVQGSSSIDLRTTAQAVPLRILFGIQGMRKTLEIEQIEISSQVNDPMFFSELKTRYKKHRWFLKRWLSPFLFRHCNFVKVSILKGSLKT
jgi:hypothetical protein